MQPSSPHSATKPAGSIVLASHEYAPFRGGVATYVHEVAAAATRLKLGVEVWTVDYAGHSFLARAKEEASNRRDAVPVVRLGSNGRLTPGGLLSLAWGFWRRRRELRGRPVVLLSVGAQMAFFLLDWLGQRPGGKIACVFHGSEVPRFQRNAFWRFLARRFYRRNCSFAATTRYVTELLRGSGLLPEGAEITRVPCALPEAFRAGAAASLAQGTANLEPEDATQHPRVLTVARLHPRKGQLAVAQALRLLPEALRARLVYQMVGVGDEVYRREVEAACQAGGVRCEFLGGLDDVALGEIYARATVYTQASRTLSQSVEGFGLTFLEAGIYGVPAAAWRSGGVEEAVCDGETGLLAAEGDVPGLAEGIRRLLLEPELRARLGGQARTFAAAFSWKQTAQILEQMVVANGS